MWPCSSPCTTCYAWLCHGCPQPARRPALLASTPAYSLSLPYSWRVAPIWLMLYGAFSLSQLHWRRDDVSACLLILPMAPYSMPSALHAAAYALAHRPHTSPHIAPVHVSGMALVLLPQRRERGWCRAAVCGEWSWRCRRSWPSMLEGHRGMWAV